MEIPIQIGNKGKFILGIIEVPENKIEGIVILCYGLNGNRVEQHRMGKKLSRYMADNNIFMVRFDYRNHGVSQGTFDEASLEGKIEDLYRVIQFIKGCNSCTTKPIYLIGYSDGAKIVSAVSKRIEGIDGLVLWNPVFDFGEKENDETPKNKKLRIFIPQKRLYQQLLGLRLNIALLKELRGDQTFDYLSMYNGGILYLFGSNDRFTKELRLKIRELPIFHKCEDEIVCIDGATHIFNNTRFEEQVFNATLAWIIKKERV